MELDTDSWSGEGAFTQVLVDALRTIEAVSFVRVEDASSSHADVEYNFISNELFVRFQTREREVRQRRFGMIPVRRQVEEAVMTMNGLERELGELDDVGLPDYADDGMLQYLRTERIVPAYQTRGYKLVELVRIYEVGADRSDEAET